MKKNKRVQCLFMFSILIIISSCQNSNNKLNELLKNRYENKSNNTHFVKNSEVTKINVPEDTYNFYHQLTVFKDTILFGFTVNNPSKIEIFNLEKSEHIRTINIPQYLLKTKRIGCFYVHSMDSIYVFDAIIPHVLLVNSYGKLINKWGRNDFKNVINGLDKIPMRSYSISSSYSNICLLNQKFYLMLEPDGFDKKGNPEFKRHGIYNLTSRKWENFFASYKGVLKEKKKGRYYRENHVSFQLVCKDKCYVSYSIDNYVYEYDLHTLKFIKKYSVGSSFVDRFPKPYYGRKSKDDSKLVKLYLDSPFYGPLQYHEGVDKFSRFCRFKDKDGNFKKTILIFNKDFDLEGESFIDNEKYGNLYKTSYGYIGSPSSSSLTNADTCIFQKLVFKHN